PRRPMLDRKVATLDPAEFAQLLHKSGDPLALDRRRARAQETDGRQLAGLLRARRKRPCSHSAAEERNELAALQSITSLARSNIDVGIVTPIALAVRRFTTSSNVVGCSTGKSAGLAPRRILWPVTLPPGRARAATRPVPSGSAAAAKTIGMTDVACFVATTIGFA